MSKLDKNKILKKMLTSTGKAFANSLISGVQAGKISKHKYLMSYSPEDEKIIEDIELLLITDDLENATMFGEAKAREFENKGKYWEAAKIYEMINEMTARMRVLKEGMVYYESIGNFGYAAGFAEMLGDFDRAEVYEYLYEIQLRLREE